VSRNDDAFDKIAQEAIGKATGVKCSIEEYIDGLNQIKGEIDVAIEASEGDLAREDNG
jgi:hypothetical protein